MQTEAIQQYLEAIYNRCYRIVRDPDLAWDALQDVFEKYYQTCQDKDIDTPLAYLYRMSTNHCLNLLRRERKTLPFLEEWEQEGRDERSSIESKLLLDGLCQQIGQEAIDLLVYRHVDQMTLGEIAAIVGISDRGVKKKLERIEHQVRELVNHQP